jgi:hypothetical protein
MSQEAQVAVDLLDAKIEDGRLDGRTEAEDVRTILELIQNLGTEVPRSMGDDPWEPRGPHHNLYS